MKILQYKYDGLMYAIDACHKKVDYYGKQEKKKNANFEITRGLSANFANDECHIDLQNELFIDGSLRDYSVKCVLPAKELQKIRPYFEELLQKYGAKRRIGAKGRILINDEEFNKETHKADIALMYYLQQNGYCQTTDLQNPFQ